MLDRSRRSGRIHTLFLEYEQVAKRLVGQIPLTDTDIEDILDYLCQTAAHQKVFYLWQPFLKDPEDDMVLELAVATVCSDWPGRTMWCTEAAAIAVFHGRGF